ncbi:uncharacterized protein LOC105691740 [Athalia rosae]|uniref:uncharacterized protein LOC105691740 n=1 Tax=Athalia rosae TaxID=37344 RepID=UPI002033EC67|nr:uncharacterized protein LOC105691740 [Athalia rosae]
MARWYNCQASAANDKMPLLLIFIGTIFTLADCAFQENVGLDFGYNNGYQNYQPVVSINRPVVVKEVGKKSGQDFSKIPGVPGVDYPIYHKVPETSFSCSNVPYAPGMYANVETGCQAYHVCHDGREGHQGASFLCTNGTLFNQHEFACDWWYNVNCADAISLYSLNLDPTKNPFVPKRKPEELETHQKLRIAVY